MAERSGLVHDLAEHPAAHGTVISVNVSALQLDDPGLVDDVAGALAAVGLLPRELVLEFTESALVGDAPPIHDRNTPRHLPSHGASTLQARGRGAAEHPWEDAVDWEMIEAYAASSDRSTREAARELLDRHRPVAPRVVAPRPEVPPQRHPAECWCPACLCRGALAGS